MVALILPMAKDSESHWFSPCSGWRSCHTLRWDSTTKSTRGCEGRGGRLRLRLDSTSDSTRGFDGPRSCPAPLQAPYPHMTPPKSNSHLEWSHVCIRWVLWRFRQRSVYGCGPLQASLGRLLTSKGCKSMIEYIKTTYVQPLTTQGEPVTAVGYGFTDLRIYPPPSPSSRAPRSRASTNQVTAGIGA